jgi:hypothetical protein
VVVPQGALRGGSGEALLSLGKVRVSGSGSTTPRFAGNFATGGKGLPRIDGTMERQARRRAVPPRHGRLCGGRPPCRARACGRADAGRGAGLFGETPDDWRDSGGRVANLACPSAAPMARTGRWPVAALHHAAFRQSGAGRDDARRARRAIARLRGSRWSGRAQPFAVAMGTPALRMSGRMGGTPMRLETGAVGLAWPGTLTARGVNLALGAQRRPPRA